MFNQSINLNIKRLKTRCLTLVAAILICSAIVHAQETGKTSRKGAINFGLVHSFNNTTFHGTFPDDSYLSRVENVYPSSRFTINLGLGIDYFLSQNTSLQFDLVFSPEGARIVDETTVYNEVGVFEGYSSSLYSLNYIKIPMLFNIYLHDIFYLNAGGYGSALVSSSTGDGPFGLFNSEKIEGIADFDAGVIGGAGVNFSYVKLGFQYSYGIIPCIENDDYSLHNGVFELVARWKFYSEVRNGQIKN